jgi:RNA polymerase nonessential primary-like sigma factor
MQSKLFKVPLKRAIMNQTRPFLLNDHVERRANVYLRAARELTQKLDHEPSAEEIATHWKSQLVKSNARLVCTERVSR